MGIKVRVKRNIGKDSEEYFGKPNGKVYELTDKFKLKDDGDYTWGCGGFKNEQEFIEYMKDLLASSTEFEVVDEKTKWKCTKLNNVSGFTEGKIYEVGEDGIIYYDSGNPCMLDTFKINGNKAECWRAKFEKVEKEKVVNKFKVGDIIKGKTNNERYGYTDKDMTKGEVTKVRGENKIEVKIIEHATCSSQTGNKYDVESDYFELVTPSSSKKSIHLTFDGNTTHAVVKEDGKVVKREKVGLFRGDVYDEATGVREVIDKLYGKKVVEDVKPKFVKAKVGDTIKIVKALPNHVPNVKNGDTFKITEVTKIYVGNSENSFGDDREEYIIIPAKSLSVGDKVKLLDGKGRPFMGGWTFSMGEEVGKIATVKEVRKDGKSVSLNEVSFVWDIDCLELVKSQISDYTTDELLSEIKKRMER